MSLYMVLVLTVELFLGEFIWDIEYAKADYGVPDNKRIHYTIIFNTFVWMQLFNEINCRMVGAKQFNVFHNIHRNWIFIGVVAGIAFLQYIFV